MATSKNTSCPPPIPAPVCLPNPCIQNHRTRARIRVTQPLGEGSLTKQEFKDDCDINRILRNYQVTGAISHYAKFAPEYGDYTACDLQSAHTMIQRAREIFDALPSSIRQLVSTPEGFLNFVQDPANAEKMRQLGLRATPVAGQAENAPEANTGARAASHMGKAPGSAGTPPAASGEQVSKT